MNLRMSDEDVKRAERIARDAGTLTAHGYVWEYCVRHPERTPVRMIDKFGLCQQCVDEFRGWQLWKDAQNEQNAA